MDEILQKTGIDDTSLGIVLQVLLSDPDRSQLVFYWRDRPDKLHGMIYGIIGELFPDGYGLFVCVCVCVCSFFLFFFSLMLNTNGVAHEQ